VAVEQVILKYLNIQAGFNLWLIVNVQVLLA